MLRRVIPNTTIREITIDGTTYVVHISGKVFVGENEVKGSTIKDGILNVPKINLINFAFKCMIPELWYTYRHFTVSRIDNNQTTDNPANLYWNNTSTIDDVDGFRPIPGYGRYLINKDGEVVNRFINKTMSPYTDKYGYLFYGMTPDVGKRLPVGRHRLMALAYLEIPSNFYRLDINHLNGIKTDNRIENLEWCSRRHNAIHAIRTGLRTDNKPVLMRDVLTNRVHEYASIGECESVNDYGKGVVGLRARSKGKLTYPDARQFCIKSEFDGWGEVDIKDILRSGVPRRLRINNGKTSREFSSMREAAEWLGIKHATLSYRLNNGITEFDGISIETITALNV